MIKSISNGILAAKINPKGAELVSLISNNREYVWEGNPDFWGKHSPILFPIVGALKNDSYNYDNYEYTLPRHGFARDMNFEVINKTSDSVCFRLKWNKETFINYPFKFEFKIEYYFIENVLNIKYSVYNFDIVDMPFSVGAHPAFALPEKFENYSLLFEKKEILKNYKLKNNLISNETININLIETNTIPLTYNLFKDDAMIFKELQSKEITILENSKPLLKVIYNDFPNLGIWTKIDAAFICIEPWLGYADTDYCTGNLLEKEGITILEPNHLKELQFAVEIL
jgi:galactose mutarotase-like enzyme